MSEIGSDAAAGAKSSGQIDLATVSIWDIIRRLNAGQAIALLGTLTSLFLGGYGVGQWASDRKHEQDIAAKLEASQKDISEKTKLISDKEAALRSVQSSLADEHRIVEDMKTLIDGANRTARAYRAKAEFLNRYYQYTQDPSPDGAMHKIFVDHVCHLWRSAQKEILETESKRLSLEDIRRNAPLSSSTIDMLALSGVTKEDIDAYRTLNERRNNVMKPSAPGVSRESQTLRQMENKIAQGINKAPVKKIVTFFDGDRYEVPPPVAHDVHFRGDCR